MKSSRTTRGIRRVDLTYTQLASSETARDINRDVVLELIRTRQPISRADLSRHSGLQRSTVSQIIEQLIKERWVREGAVAHLPRGRRPTLLGLNDDLVVIVADIHPKQATVAVVDLNGRLLSRALLPIGSDPALAVAGIIDCMKRMRERHTGKSFEGVGISVPGRVDPESQRLIFAPNLKWSEFDIKGTIERGMNLPVEVENAANACLLAELWFGRMDGIRNAVLVTVSEGIGAGILANGQLVPGSLGMAGEFGHIPLDPSGPRCGCGLHGCWETFASCNAALRYYKESASGTKRPTFHDLMNLAKEGDSHAIDALTKQAESLGRGLRLITAALSPEVILLAGDITAAWQLFAPVIEREIASRMLAGEPPRILPTHEGEIARLRGAAALLLQRRSRPGSTRAKPAAKPETRKLTRAAPAR